MFRILNFSVCAPIEYLTGIDERRNYNCDVQPREIQWPTLTLRRLMSHIYMEHPFLMFLDHTQRRSTVGRTPLDE